MSLSGRCSGLPKRREVPVSTRSRATLSAWPIWTNLGESRLDLGQSRALSSRSVATAPPTSSLPAPLAFRLRTLSPAAPTSATSAASSAAVSAAVSAAAGGGASPPPSASSACSMRWKTILGGGSGWPGCRALPSPTAAKERPPPSGTPIGEGRGEAARADLGYASAMPRLCLGCTSAVPRLHLGCTSAVFRLCFGCISAMPQLYLG